VPLICFAYMASVLAGYSYAAVFPSFRTAFQVNASDIVDLSSALMVSACISKIFISISIGKLGAAMVIFVASALQALVILCIAQADTFGGVRWYVGLAEFFGNLTFPSSVQLIEQCTQTLSDRSHALWLLALGSRIASVSCGPILGFLDAHLSWRMALRVSVVFPLAACFIMLSFNWGTSVGIYRKKQVGEEPPLNGASGNQDLSLQDRETSAHEYSNSTSMVLRMLTSRMMWWAALGSSSLNVVKTTFQYLLSIYLVDSAQKGVISDQFAIFLSPVCTLGVLTSVLVAGHWFTILSSERKLKLVTILSGVSTVALFVIAVDSLNLASHFVHIAMRAVLFFFAGLGMGISFYQPPNLFAINFGGAQAGTVTAWLEFTNYFASFAFSKLTNLCLNQSFGWSRVWLLCSILNGVGSALTLVYLKHDLEAHPAAGQSE